MQGVFDWFLEKQMTYPKLFGFFLFDNQRYGLGNTLFWVCSKSFRNLNGFSGSNAGNNSRSWALLIFFLIIFWSCFHDFYSEQKADYSAFGWLLLWQDLIKSKNNFLNIICTIIRSYIVRKVIPCICDLAQCILYVVFSCL